jgi:prevent-host-death family protein
MQLQEQIKPISYLKSKAADIAKDFEQDAQPLIITQNGEAKMVVMGIAQYQEQAETLALLKLLALGRKEYEGGDYLDADAALAGLEAGDAV